MGIYDDTYQVYGIKNQIHKFSEELFELGQAMHHWYDDKITDEELADEIADVKIVCDQLSNLIGNDKVTAMKIAKLIRLRKDIDECLRKKPWIVQGTQWNATPLGMLQSILAYPKSILNSSFIKNIRFRITRSWGDQEKE